MNEQYAKQDAAEQSGLAQAVGVIRKNRKQLNANIVNLDTGAANTQSYFDNNTTSVADIKAQGSSYKGPVTGYSALDAMRASGVPESVISDRKKQMDQQQAANDADFLSWAKQSHGYDLSGVDPNSADDTLGNKLYWKLRNEYNFVYDTLKSSFDSSNQQKQSVFNFNEELKKNNLFDYNNLTKYIENENSKIETTQKAYDEYSDVYNQVTDWLNNNEYSDEKLQSLIDSHPTLSMLDKYAKDRAEKYNYLSTILPPGAATAMDKSAADALPADLGILKQMGYDEKSGFQGLYDKTKSRINMSQNINKALKADLDQYNTKMAGYDNQGDTDAAIRLTNDFKPYLEMAGLDTDEIIKNIGAQAALKPVMRTLDELISQNDYRGAHNAILNNQRLLRQYGVNPVQLDNDVNNQIQSTTDKGSDTSRPLDWTDSKIDNGEQAYVSNYVNSTNKNTPSGTYVVVPATAGGEAVYALQYLPNEADNRKQNADERTYIEFYPTVEYAQQIANLYSEQLKNGQDWKSLQKEPNIFKKYLATLPENQRCAVIDKMSAIVRQEANNITETGLKNIIGSAKSVVLNLFNATDSLLSGKPLTITPNMTFAQYMPDLQKIPIIGGTLTTAGEIFTDPLYYVGGFMGTSELAAARSAMIPGTLEYAKAMEEGRVLGQTMRMAPATELDAMETYKPGLTNLPKYTILPTGEIVPIGQVAERTGADMLNTSDAARMAEPRSISAAENIPKGTLPDAQLVAEFSQGDVDKIAELLGKNKAAEGELLGAGAKGKPVLPGSSAKVETPFKFETSNGGKIVGEQDKILNNALKDRLASLGKSDLKSGTVVVTTKNDMLDNVDLLDRNTAGRLLENEPGIESRAYDFTGTGYEGKESYAFTDRTIGANKQAQIWQSEKSAATAAGKEGGKGENIIQNAENIGVENKGVVDNPPLVKYHVDGSFEIINWEGYPDGPKPEGDLKLIEGEEYEIARKKADSVNKRIHDNNRPDLDDIDIHEIHLIKFGGSPTDLSNKAYLDPKIHDLYTIFWNNVQRSLEGK